MPSQTPTLEFHYDISCPFAYIASTLLPSLASRTSVPIIYRPTLLGAIYRLTSAPQGAAGSASDVFNPTKKRISSQAFARTLKRLGVEYNEPPKHPVKTTAALRLLYFLEREGDRVKVTEGLFRAYWVQGRDVSRRDLLVGVVRGCGLERSEESRVVKGIESGEFEGERERGLLEQATNDAVERGAPGVPGFWVGDEVWRDAEGRVRKGRLYWGQDRIHFVEAVLEAMKAGKDGLRLGEGGVELQGLLRRVKHREGIPSGVKKVRLEFWYDFSSPWAFLGWTQLARLQRRFGSKLEIDMKPCLLGILFREIGAPNVPSLAISKQKNQYMKNDHVDWVRFWNAVNEQEGRPDKNIDFKWASKFPIRTPNLLRAVLVEPSLVDVLFRACWERDLDMSSDDVLKQVIIEAGFSGDKIFERANSKDIKDLLRERTKQAKDIGLNGVPSYRIFRDTGAGWQEVDGIVWGQDEIPVVEDLIAGWDPSQGKLARVERRSVSPSARL